MPAPAEGDYAPRLPPRLWERVREFTESVVAEVHPLTSYSKGELMLSVSRLAIWSRTSIGPDLPRAYVLSAHNIERYTSVGMPDASAATRSTTRARLRRVSEALNIAPAPPVLPAPRQQEAVAPYSSEEVAELIAWARTLSTQQRRDDAMVLLALGLGAGLQAAEIGAARVQDLRQDDGFSITVGGSRPRLVPVLVRWERVIERQLARGPNEFLFRPRREASFPNLISNFVTQSPGAIRPHTQRMRFTWIVAQLNALVPPKTILEAAGLDTLGSLDRFLPYVASLDRDLSTALLRGASAEPVEP